MGIFRSRIQALAWLLAPLLAWLRFPQPSSCSHSPWLGYALSINHATDFWQKCAWGQEKCTMDGIMVEYGLRQEDKLLSLTIHFGKCPSFDLISPHFSVILTAPPLGTCSGLLQGDPTTRHHRHPPSAAAQKVLINKTFYTTSEFLPKFIRSPVKDGRCVRSFIGLDPGWWLVVASGG